MFIPFGPAVSYPYKPVKARISVDAIVNISTPSLGSDLFLQVDLVSFHNHFSDRPGIRDFAMAPTRTRQSENVSGTVLPIPASLTRPASTCRPKHLNSLFQKSYGTDDHSVRPQLFILSAMLGDRLKPRQEKTAKSVQLPHSPVRSRDVRGTDGAYRACLGVLPAPGRRRPNHVSGRRWCNWLKRKHAISFGPRGSTTSSPPRRDDRGQRSLVLLPVAGVPAHGGPPAQGAGSSLMAISLKRIRSWSFLWICRAMWPRRPTLCAACVSSSRTPAPS